MSTPATMDEDICREWGIEPGDAPPAWLKIRVPIKTNPNLRACITDLGRGTVCASARCPNQLSCHSRGRATFLLMGPDCTRHCRFCAVSRGTPAPLEEDEPARVAEAVRRLQLQHAVITSVTRDDLIRGGAEHFAETVSAVREHCPEATVEILVPDFNGDENAWKIAASIAPDVFNHNLETVPRLYPEVRPEADYDRSLALLDYVSENARAVRTKSGLMVGLGEEPEEILEVAEDLRSVGVSMITVGQYLCPDRHANLPVRRYIQPDAFAWLHAELVALGFSSVACNALVRSSHDAQEALARASANPI